MTHAANLRYGKSRPAELDSGGSGGFRQPRPASFLPLDSIAASRGSFGPLDTFRTLKSPGTPGAFFVSLCIAVASGGGPVADAMTTKLVQAMAAQSRILVPYLRHRLGPSCQLSGPIAKN